MFLNRLNEACDGVLISTIIPSRAIVGVIYYTCLHALASMPYERLLQPPILEVAQGVCLRMNCISLQIAEYIHTFKKAGVDGFDERCFKFEPNL